MRSRIAREPDELLAVVEAHRGDGARPEADALQRGVQRRRQLDDVVLDALQLERALHRRAGVRAVDDVELERHRPSIWSVAGPLDSGPRCCSSSTSGTPRRTSGRSRASSCVEHWRFATVRESTADELGARAARAARAARRRARRPRRLDRLLDRAAARARVGGDGRALPRRTACSSSGPASAPACRCATTTRARSAPTAWSTRSPATTASRGACIVVDFGTALTYDPVSARRRVPRRHHRAGRRDLARGAHRAARPSCRTSTSSPPRSLIGKTTVDAIRSGIVYGFAGQVDAIVRRLRDELGEDTETIATGGLAASHRPVHGDDRRGRRPADPERAEAAARAQLRRSALG